MRRFFLLALPTAVSACVALDTAPSISTEALAAPVIAAERAFARRHQQVPLKQAFLEYSAPHGIAVRPAGVRNVKEDLMGWPTRADTGSIAWWPMLAGVARSGELGFTTGPATYPGGFYGGYFTIWEKQADGSWKWLIDQGTGQSRTPPSSKPEDNVALIPVSTLPRSDPAQARDELLALDTELGRRSADDVTAIGERLAPDAYLLGFGKQPAKGSAAAQAALRERPAKIAMKPEGGGVSAAGDFGWTYGYADWVASDGEKKRGAYMRAWQRRPAGWLIVVDNLNPFGPR